MRIRITQERRRREAFTLMEVLVVAALIVILAGVGGYYLMGAWEKGKINTAQAQVRELTKAAETYKLNNGDFPPTLDVLLQTDSQGNPPILKSADALKTPWGKAYGYDANGPKNNHLQPDIWADPPNGQPIGNWPSGR